MDGIVDLKEGSRVVGMFSHITSVISFLFYARHNMQTVQSVRNWSESIDDASDLPDMSFTRQTAMMTV